MSGPTGLLPVDARWGIAATVFDALGLTAGEREAVYAGVAELVEHRRWRARVAGKAKSHWRS